jgi:hypothetical protein
MLHGIPFEMFGMPSNRRNIFTVTIDTRKYAIPVAYAIKLGLQNTPKLESPKRCQYLIDSYIT